MASAATHNLDNFLYNFTNSYYELKVYIYTNLNRCILLFLQRRLWLFSINKKVEVAMGACQGLSSTYRVIFGCWPTTDPRDTLAISSHSFHTRTHKTSVIDRNQSQKKKRTISNLSIYRTCKLEFVFHCYKQMDFFPWVYLQSHFHNRKTKRKRILKTWKYYYLII